MGSKVFSQSATSTANVNAPVTQENVSNPINLSNSARSSIGNTSLSAGGSINTLDGGAIKEAFAFADRAVMAVADLTRSANQTATAANAGALGIAQKAQDSLEKNVVESDNFLANKNLLIVAAVVAVAYFYFRK